MSFFNLTSLGYQNQFQSTKRLEPISTKQLRTIPTVGQNKSSLEKQLARDVTGNYQSREWSTPAISNVNYHSLRRMHVRGDQDPYQITRRSLTEAQEIGKWRKDEPLKINEPWIRKEHHVHAPSEMTKFVNDMLITDRSFRLF